MTPGIFVTGTDTGVGKTLVSRLLAEGFREAGGTVGVLKPFLSGGWGDARILAKAAGGSQRPEDLCVLVCRKPLAPAAVLGTGEAGGRRVRAALGEMARRIRGLAGSRDAVLVEGLGGALAPLGGRLTVADAVVRAGFPVWIVARPGLGTLNHTLMTVEVLRARGAVVKRVLLSGWTGTTRAERGNPLLLRRLARLPVTRIPRVRPGRNATKARRTLLRAFLEDTRK